MKTFRTSPTLVGAALGVAATLTATRARANDDSTQIALFLGALSGGLVGAPGIVVAAVNGYSAGKDERPTSGWRTAGYVFGGLNLAAGGLYMATAPQGSSVWLPGIGIGAAHIAVAIVDIAVTGVAGAKPEPSGAFTALVPVLLWDTRGRAAPGAGLLVRAF